MYTLRAHLLISAGLFAALIGIALVGNPMQRAGVAPPSGPMRYVAAGLYFALFLAFGFSLVPVLVKLVIAAQVRGGNQGLGIVGAVIRHQNGIVWAMWGVMLAGTLIAVPAAIYGGLFGDAPKRAIDRMLVGPSRGRLVARPGMTLEDLVRQSTLPLDLKHANAAIAGGNEGPFEFAIPGTGISFARARYYFMTTSSADPNDHLVGGPDPAGGHQCRGVTREAVAHRHRFRGCGACSAAFNGRLARWS